ncbi:MAG TPA: leucyl aminopeptidase, partial [Vicinamibacterales bacterium]
VAGTTPTTRIGAPSVPIAREGGVAVEILDEDEISKLKMGLLLGVARGSVEPPRVIVLRHDPPHAPARPVLGLVGKGITFDTGGISIKPADGMERMKDDMAGGAAVVCAMRAIGLLRAPIRVVGVVPTTENMPGGRALKPGDILTGASGKTVEVINTDAEGRLILGDGVWYARQLGATHLVDVATLTGACVVALGKIASGLFGTPDAWRDVVAHVAERAGDRCWPMPLYDEYFDQLKSDIADMMNTGGRPAGACTAAMFIRQFAGDAPWAHLDIAGTAWADEAKPFQPKGPIGVAVRTLAELAFTADRWPSA